MIDQLFGSKTRVKLLKLFFSNPNRSFYVREITRMVDEQINSVRRELANLLSLGLISSDSTNNKLYYEVNQDYEYFDALQAMFARTESREELEPTKELADKTSADETPAGTNDKATDEKTVKPKPVKKVTPTDNGHIELPEANRWNKAGNIDGIAYSGVYTRDETANVDILIVGDAVISKIESIIVELEKDKNKELRYAVIEGNEWRYRGQVRDKFWLQFMGAKKQIVLDKNNIFKDK